LANSAKCCFPVPLQEKKEGEDFPENPLIFWLMQSYRETEYIIEFTLYSQYQLIWH
jgi:hypothetical protein